MKLKFWKQRRHIVAVMTFLVLFNMFSLSTNLSVAIVGMIKIQNHTLLNGTIVQLQDFHWSSETQGLVLSSYYYGNICTFVIGGWLASRFGGATVLTVTAMLAACVTFAMPELPKLYLSDHLNIPPELHEVGSLVFLRICLGGLQGFVLPCINELWSKWVPAAERSSICSFVMSGCFVGTVCVLSAAGLISKYFGWPAVFYITGYCSFLWGLLSAKVVKNDPAEDPRISKEELTYIQFSIGTTSRNGKHHFPWKNFFTSMPIWAVFVAHFCANWGLFTILTEFPMFLYETTNFDIYTIGFLAALPYVANALTLQFSGRLADRLQNSEKYSVTTIRKMFLCSSFIVQMLFIGIAGLTNFPALVIIGVVVTISFDAFAWSAFGVNFLDIATPYASVLMGISSTFATTPGIISPLVTGALVTDMKDYTQWRLVFLLCSLIYLFGAVFYGIFASADRQEWSTSNIQFIGHESSCMTVSNSSLQHVLQNLPASDETMSV